ncbi:MAG: LamG domain-containing protein [Acidobacteriota bacterium]|nr:LamG domain-containing protein [Acidobacteriota bacterium]
MIRLSISLALITLASFTLASEWPPLDEDLIFLFQDSYEEPFALDTELDEPLLNYQLSPLGEARFDSRGCLALHRGSFTAPNQDDVLPLAVEPGGDFSVELWLQPDKAQSARILAFGSAFALSQESNRLVFSVDNTKLKADLPESKHGNHVIAAYSKKTMTLYIDGKPAANLEMTDAAKAWVKAPLTFGSGSSDKEGWLGFLADIAVYSGAFNPKRAEQHYGAHQKTVMPGRETPNRLILDGKLLAMSKVSTPAEIDPYAASLSVFEYQVVKVHQGFNWDKRIRVAHWVVLDYKALPVAKSAVGDQHRLVLEPFAANRQLANTHRTENLPTDRKIKLYLATNIQGR